MDDELKRYVDDFEVPGEGFEELWSGIDKGLEAKKAKRVSLHYRKLLAIAAMLVLAVGIAWVSLKVDSAGNTIAKAPEWLETEEFYSAQIREKMQVLETKRGELDQTVFEDLEMLDKAFTELKEDLQDNADNEEVIEAMIQNYRIKLQILEEILQEIEADETEETTDTAAT